MEAERKRGGEGKDLKIGNCKTFRMKCLLIKKATEVARFGQMRGQVDVRGEEE